MENNLLFWDITSLILKDDWTQLVNRDRGKKLREKLYERIDDLTKLVVLDFSMVNKIDKSFIDAFLLPILKDFKNKLIVGVNIKGYLLEKTDISDEVELEDIDDFLRKANMEFLVISDDGRPYLLGSNNKCINKVLRVLNMQNSLTLEQICFELDEESEEIKNSIEYLLERGLIILKASSAYEYTSYEFAFRERLKPYVGISLETFIRNKYDKIIEKGHFELPSGVHTDTLYHVSKLLEEPRFTMKMGRYFADLLGDDIDFVLTIETPNNIILAHRVAQAIGSDTRSIFAKLDSQKSGELVLHEGFKINQNERGLIVVDVVVTGLNAGMLINLLKKKNGSVRGICSIFDLSGGRIRFPPFTYRSLVRDEIKIYQPYECPLCKDTIPLFRPKIMPGDWKW